MILIAFLTVVPSCWWGASECAAQGSLSQLDSVEEAGPWEIRADSLSYDEEAGIYVAEGDVVISKAGNVLYAQQAVYNISAKIAEVSGGVRFESGGDVLEGDRGFFDLQDRTGEIVNGRLFIRENHVYLSGEVMEKTGENTYRVKNCQVTTCDGDHPDWAIRGSEVEVTVEGYGTVEHATFRVRDMPVLYFPYAFFPAKTKRQSGLLFPRLGYSSRNGADVEVPLYWVISDQADATFYQRYMDERGYMQGVEFRYVLDRPSRGTVLYDVLFDDKKDKDLNDPDDVELSPFPRTNDTRYWLRGKADHELPLGVTARVDGDYVSDQDYLKEFEGDLFGFEARPELAHGFSRPVEERRSPFRTSNLRLSREAENYSIQGLAAYYQTQFLPEEERERVAQPVTGFDFVLPALGFTSFPMFLALQSDYDYVWREEGVRGNRFSAAPEMRFPLWLGPYVEFESSFGYGYTAQWFDEDFNGDDQQSKHLYAADFRLLTNLERVYDIDWRNAKRLKHRIWPELSYTYSIPQDEDVESPWFEPVDAVGKINRLRFSLENFLDARLESEKGAVTHRQWAKLRIIQDYDIDEARRDEEPERDEEPFSPLFASLIVTPFSDLDLRGNLLWDHYDQEITAGTLSLDLFVPRAGGKRDIYRLDYRFREPERETVNLLADINLAYGFSVGGSLKRDVELSENISSRYWVEYEEQCWAVGVVWEEEENDTRVKVMVTLTGLGDIRAF